MPMLFFQNNQTVVFSEDRTQRFFFLRHMHIVQSSVTSSNLVLLAMGLTTLKKLLPAILLTIKTTLSPTRQTQCILQQKLFATVNVSLNVKPFSLYSTVMQNHLRWVLALA